MNARAAAGAVLIVALVGLSSGSAALGAQQQTGAQPPAGDGHKPAPPPGKKTENDDLDKIPNPQSSGDAEHTQSGTGNQRLYVENAFTGSTGRSTLLVPVPQSTASTWQVRVFVDVRREWRAGRRLTLTFSDRLNVRAENDLAFPTQQNVTNDWRGAVAPWGGLSDNY